MAWVLPLTSLQLRLKTVTTCKASLKSPAQNMLGETCFQLQSPSPLLSSQNSPFSTWRASYPNEWTFSMKPAQCQGQGKRVTPAPCPSTNLPSTGLLTPAEPQPVMGSPLPAPGSVPGLCIPHSWFKCNALLTHPFSLLIPKSICYIHPKKHLFQVVAIPLR